MAVGDMCWVSGTTDAGPDGRSQHPGDVAAQAREAFALIERALTEAGFGLADVVRTRIFVTDISHSDELATIHGELFGDVRPAATMIEVSRLIDPSLLVEIEVDARRS